MHAIEDPPEMTVQEFTAAIAKRELARQMEIQRNLRIVGGAFVVPTVGGDSSRGRLGRYVRPHRRYRRRKPVMDIDTREKWSGPSDCAEVLNCPACQVRTACIKVRQSLRKGAGIPKCRGRRLIYVEDYERWFNGKAA